MIHTTSTPDPLREAVDYIDALIDAEGEILLEGQAEPCGIVVRARAALAAAPPPAPDREGDAVAKAAKAILSQPKRPVGPVADAFGAACAYLSDRECGAETTNEIIETFLKALAGEDN